MKSKKFLPRFLRVLATVAIVLLMMYVFRHPLMRCVGNYLIDEDDLQTTETLFVLSGNAESRAKESAKLLRSAYAKEVVCTGEVVPDLFKEVGINMNEAELSRNKLLKEGISERRIKLLPIGTSTREEADAILAYCKINHIRKIMVVSDKFHTNRIDYAFREQFDDAGIKLILRGAPAMNYNEDFWWANEAGLLMVNNEYVKLFYYWINY